MGRRERRLAVIQINLCEFANEVLEQVKSSEPSKVKVMVDAKAKEILMDLTQIELDEEYAS